MKIISQIKSASAAGALALSLVATGQVDATVLTQWNFNGSSATTVPGGELSPAPSTGAGTAGLIGGVTAAASFGSGTSNGGSSDPVITTPSNYAWQTTTYAAQGAENGLRGVQFMVSTVGFSSITINWDQRHSNTSSRFAQLQYSVDGLNFTSSGLAGNGIFEAGQGGDTWYNNRSVDLSAIAGASNNSSFAFRIVAVFDPASGSAYSASSPASSYAASGTWRFDMITVNGSAIPAPGALALLGMAGFAASTRRRRRH